MKQTLETKCTRMKYYGSRCLLKTPNSPMKLKKPCPGNKVQLEHGKSKK